MYKYYVFHIIGYMLYNLFADLQICPHDTALRLNPLRTVGWHHNASQYSCMNPAAARVTVYI